jgi:1,5-anhydro-D-fructose reductase (1,5-anhydro-D-mannitol-forming)
MIRVAMLSFWHVHAGDYASQAAKHPDTEIVAIWDELPERGRKEAEKRGVRFFESLDDLLAQQEIDAVIVNTPTNLHHEAMVKAANAGKHIFTEKVLAPTLQEANDILAAVEKNGVMLTVSLPRLNDGYTLKIQEILKEGLLGELTLVRVRLAHDGATKDWLPEHFYNPRQTLGGAMIDLGCHPMYLTRLFLGFPESVSAHYGYMTGKEVEDNAVSILKYPNGALGMAEAGFVTSHTPFTIEIHGQDGSLFFGTPKGHLLLKTSRQDEAAAKQWTELPLPDKVPSAFDQWVGHILNNTTATENIQLALDLTKLMEASNLSAAQNRSVLLSELKG